MDLCQCLYTADGHSKCCRHAEFERCQSTLLMRQNWLRHLVVVVQSALPDFFIAHSALGRVGSASKVVSHPRSYRLTQTIGERFRNMPKALLPKLRGGLGAGVR